MPLGNKKIGPACEIKPLLAKIRKALRAAHDPVRAENEKRYLKSPYKFLGVNIPTLRKLAKEIRKDLAPASRTTVFELAGTLWKSEFHQEKTIAIFLLKEYPEHLDIKAMPMLDNMLKDCTGWDHTDYIATGLVSEVLKKTPKAYRFLRKWRGSGTLWVRRASLISQIPLLRKGEGDRKLFFSLADDMIGEKEFFIRKAIGWTVRELSKSDPEAARDFLLSVKGRASGLAMREGAKRLPAIMKKEVLGK